MIVLIAFIIAAALLVYHLVINVLFGKHVEVNFSRGKIYGWYNGEILCSDNVDIDMSLEKIKKRKENISKRLDELIIKYKKI